MLLQQSRPCVGFVVSLAYRAGVPDRLFQLIAFSRGVDREMISLPGRSALAIGRHPREVLAISSQRGLLLPLSLCVRCRKREGLAMKTVSRNSRSDKRQSESPDALRERLAAFAVATRDLALQRSKVQEPVVGGGVLAGRRIRSKD